MNPETVANPLDAWRDFLIAQGAVIEAGEVRHFGDAAAERLDADILVDLSHLALIECRGADVVTFLNGQLTCDVREITPDRSVLGAWCSPKGRMLAIFRILRHDEAYWLQLPASLSADVLKRLRMYVLRSKVTLQPADDRLLRFGVAGPNAAALVRAAAGGAPQTDDGVTAADGVILCRLPGRHPRFEILAPAMRGMELWRRLAQRAAPAGAPAWTWHDIAAGIPTVLPETREAFVPQMANLELLGGVSFAKGCYTGQEIVARVHYRGRLKQRMYRLHVAQETTPAPGEPIYAAGTDQSSGTVVVAAPAPGGGQDLLAVVYCDRIDGELRLGGPNGAPLSRESLPYPVTVPEGA